MLSPAFRKAIALNPNLLAPHLFGGLAWYQLSRPDAAVPELETAVRLRSSDVIAHTWLGYAYVAQSRYDAAAKQFEEASRLAPENIDAWYALGEAYLQIGKAEHPRALKLAPDGGRAWQLAGEQFQLQGDRSKALEDFEQANARRPDIAELRTAVTELGGNPEPAALPRALQAAEEDALYAQAHDAEQKSRYCIRACALPRARLLSRPPDHGGRIRPRSSRTKRRSREYRIVLQSKPDLPGIHEAIGSSLLRSGKSAEALAEFQAELQLQPRSASVNTLLGQTLLLLGKNEEAEKALRSALLMDRPPPDAYRLLGKLDLHRSDYRAAVDDLTHYPVDRGKTMRRHTICSRAPIAGWAGRSR